MKRVFKMKEQQFLDLFGIKGHGHFSSYVERYMPLSRALEFLKHGRLVFVTPDLWKDPFESLYYKSDFTGLGYQKPENVYCLCVRNSSDNEEASWAIYKDSKEPLVRITFDFYRFLQSFKKNSECSDIYVRKVDYNHNQQQIKNLYDVDYDHFFENMSDDKYITLLSLKRPAYKYEDELRFFVIPKKCSNVTYKDDNHKLLEVPIDVDAVKKITIYPEKCDSEIDRKIYTVWRNHIKSEILKIRPNIKVKRSSLYDSIQEGIKINSNGNK